MKINVVAPADVAVPPTAAGLPISVPEPLPLPARGSPIVYRAKLLGARGHVPLHPNDNDQFAADLELLTRRERRHVRAIVLRADFDDASLTRIISALRNTDVERLDLMVKD